MTDEQAKRVIGENVTRYRGEMSVNALARLCETSPIQISRVGRGLHMPGVGLLTRIAEALGVTPNDLLTPVAAKARKRA